MQAHNAEQDAAGTGRLRGRESSQIAEDVLSQMGVYIHAGESSITFPFYLIANLPCIAFPFSGRVTEQGGEEAGQIERKVLDSQERAFWDVHRPMPGCVNTTEIDIKKAYRRGGSSHGTGSAGASVAKNPVEQLTRIIALRKQKLERRTIKVSKAAEA